MKQQLLFTNEVDGAIESFCVQQSADKLFVLCDTNTAQCVFPRLQASCLKAASLITVQAGDMNKNLDSLSSVWNALSDMGATRKSLLINIGGGMVTDLGGFAASAFKRGIPFVNVPTTLLGAVDAAVGGKTGINFNGLKNEIGAFALADAVIISACFFSTLPKKELLSGYAEMLKHGLLDNIGTYNALLDYDIKAGVAADMLPLLQQSVQVKERIVADDPHEQGFRKALNLGHTFGHAFESHAMRHATPVPHGYAVAWGLVCELLLSHRLLGFPTDIIYDFARFIDRCYGGYAITCDDYEELYVYMTHDKKNVGGNINFTLLRHIGQPVVDCHVDRKEIEVILDIYRDLFHL